ncbi:hypothetical protein CMK11_08100 [Candidatus Poribacteria bacterium]|nr:hypothetical protein [Candidatus Poribacteria bacterium]
MDRRGSWPLLALGIGSVVLFPPVGVVAWAMAWRALRRMADGDMPEGTRWLTKVTMALGIIGTALTLTFATHILIEKEILPNPFAAEYVVPPPSPDPPAR